MGKLLVSDFEGGSMMEVILYTTDCPKCKILEKKLTTKNVTYSVVKDISVMQELGIYSSPCLSVDEKILDFIQSIDWVNGVR